MARIRTLKPEFFLDETLAKVSPAHRLLFAGLWTLADKNGRLEDSPMRIKAQLFPYEEQPVDQMLSDLDALGPIHRYQANGRRLIAIPKFGKHQRPHPKEAETDIPEPPSREIKRQEINDSLSIPSSPPGKGRSLGKESLDNGKEISEAPLSPVSATDAIRPSPETVKALAGEVAPRAIEAPAGPPEGWTGSEFWQWAQFIRQENGYVPEKWPDHRDLGAWWSGVLGTRGVTVQRLKQAFYAYGDTEFWKPRLYPFGGFRTQWASFMPQEARHAAQ